jgi:hypothetical protein
MTRTRKPARPSFATLEPAKIAALCAALQGDGHSILYPAMFTDKFGIPAEMIQPLVFNYQSDTRSHKSTIYAPGGAALKELRGVGALSLYETIAGDLGLPGSTASGRGFRAQECHRQITDWCREQLGEDAARSD